MTYYIVFADDGAGMRLYEVEALNLHEAYEKVEDKEDVYGEMIAFTYAPIDVYGLETIKLI